MGSTPSGDITRIVLIVLLIGLLLLGSFWTLLPFLGALVWATTIVVATWPTMIRVQRMTGGRRGVAVAVMTVLMLAALIVPLTFAISTLLDAAWRSPAVMKDFMVGGLGEPPRWVETIPVVGRQVADQWRQIAAGGPGALAEFARPYARETAGWVIAATGGAGALLLQFLLIVVLMVILYSQGEVAAAGALAFGRRIGAERGEKTIRLAGQAVRSVALGVVGTALVQSLLAGAGLWVTGVPHAGLLTALAFVMCIAQIGPTLVLAPAIIWLVLDRQQRPGHRAPDRGSADAHARQRAAAAADPSRRSAADAAHHRRRHRRSVELWRYGAVCGASDSRVDIHARKGMGRRGPDGSLAPSRQQQALARQDRRDLEVRIGDDRTVEGVDRSSARVGLVVDPPARRPQHVVHDEKAAARKERPQERPVHGVLRLVGVHEDESHGGRTELGGKTRQHVNCSAQLAADAGRDAGLGEVAASDLGCAWIALDGDEAAVGAEAARYMQRGVAAERSDLDRGPGA